MNSTGTINPLSKHFRQPVLHFSLPSKGKYWPEGSLDLPITREIPVYPMTTKDEIVLKTPDALINGSSVATVIESCCPSIKNAWTIPTIDIDAILIAIRIASYGEEMTITCTCPACKDVSDYDINLTAILGSIQSADYSDPVEVDGLSIRLKPQCYRDLENANQIRFQEQQIIKSLASSEVADSERAKLFDQHIEKFVDLSIDGLVTSTESVTTSDGTVVTNSEFINEFYKNCDNKVIKRVRQQLEKIATDREIKAQSIKCTECGHTYETRVEFNASNFFV